MEPFMIYLMGELQSVAEFCDRCWNELNQTLLKRGIFKPLQTMLPKCGRMLCGQRVHADCCCTFAVGHWEWTMWENPVMWACGALRHYSLYGWEVLVAWEFMLLPGSYSKSQPCSTRHAWVVLLWLDDPSLLLHMTTQPSLRMDMLDVLWCSQFSSKKQADGGITDNNATSQYGAAHCAQPHSTETNLNWPRVPHNQQTFLHVFTSGSFSFLKQSVTQHGNYASSIWLQSRNNCRMCFPSWNSLQLQHLQLPPRNKCQWNFDVDHWPNIISNASVNGTHWGKVVALTACCFYLSAVPCCRVPDLPFVTSTVACYCNSQGSCQHLQDCPKSGWLLCVCEGCCLHLLNLSDGWHLPPISGCVIVPKLVDCCYHSQPMFWQSQWSCKPGNSASSWRHASVIDSWLLVQAFQSFVLCL